MKPFWVDAGLTVAGFVLVAAAFFVAMGQPPASMLVSMVAFAFGDAYSLNETLAKTAPILACALAAAIPGRLGLISVGAEGQLHAGAIAGTALVLLMPALAMPLMLPGMLILAAMGGAAYGLVPGLMRVRLGVNETITTLVMNYIAILFVNALVYGPWRDAANQGWPATAMFPDAARLPQVPGTGVHLGLVLAVLIAIGLHVFFSRGRSARAIRILAGNRKVGTLFGLNFGRWAVVLMAGGGAVAGLAGIAEVAAIQGRLQPGLSLGYGLSGFLVAWLSGHRPLVILPVSFLVGGLLAASDALQLFAKVPAASAVLLQGLLFAIAMAIPGLTGQWRRHRGR